MDAPLFPSLSRLPRRARERMSAFRRALLRRPGPSAEWRRPRASARLAWPPPPLVPELRDYPCRPRR